MASVSAVVGEQDLDQMSTLFRLLCDKTRLSILLRLAQGERNVSSLCQELQLPQPTVSHHLGLLRINNLITNRRKGKQVFYVLAAGVHWTQDAALDLGLENFQIRIGKRA